MGLCGVISKGTPNRSPEFTSEGEMLDFFCHYGDVIMGAVVSQITSVTIVYSIVCSGADLRKHQSSVSLAFVRGIHRWLVNSPHEGPVRRNLSPFDDVIMCVQSGTNVLAFITDTPCIVMFYLTAFWHNSLDYENYLLLRDVSISDMTYYHKL